MSSVQRIRQALEQQRQQYVDWLPEVQCSRIVIRPDDTSYLDQVGVYVKTIMHRLDEGISLQTIMQDYPNLTYDDLEACCKFWILRTRRML